MDEHPMLIKKRTVKNLILELAGEIRGRGTITQIGPDFYQYLNDVLVEKIRTAVQQHPSKRKTLTL